MIQITVWLFEQVLTMFWLIEERLRALCWVEVRFENVCRSKIIDKHIYSLHHPYHPGCVVFVN